MALKKEVQYSGNARTSTLNGNIEINEGTGELIVRNGAQILTRVSGEGFDYLQNGTHRIRIGRRGGSSDIGIYVSKPGVDVLEEIE